MAIAARKVIIFVQKLHSAFQVLSKTHTKESWKR